MTRIIRRQVTHTLQAGDQDQVVSHCALPEDSKLNHVWLDIQGVGAAAGISPVIATPVGFSGYIMRVDDPDTPDSVDDIWDRMVPKDIALATNVGVEEDTLIGAETTAPNYELGQVDPNTLFMVDSMVKEIFLRREILTAARSRMTAVSGTSLWIPSFEFKSEISRRYSVPTPSIAAFAVSVPAGDITTATVDNTPTRPEWQTIRFIELALEKAFVFLLGLEETGAESPYTDIATTIFDFIEPAVFEETAGAIGQGAFNVWSKITYDVTVLGTMGKQVITSE